MAARKFRPKVVKAEVVGRAEIIGIKPAARESGIPESSIRRWRETPEMALLRAETRDAVAADVWAAFQKGVRRIAELMDTTTDMAKVAVASGILYDKLALMSGEATSRTETKALTDDLSDDEKQRLRQWIVDLPAAIPDPRPAG